MILPVIGRLENPKRHMSGVSSHSGFQLQFHQQDGYTLFFNTRNYSEDKTGKKYLNNAGINRISGLIALLAASTSIYRHQNMPASIPSIIALVANCILSPIAIFLAIRYAISIVAILIAFRKDTELREWHSAEHRAIFLLRNGIAPTVKNLQTAQSISLYCGIVSVVLMLECAICFILLLTLFWVLPGVMAIQNFICALSSLIALGTVLYLLLLGFSPYLDLLIVVALLPALIVPLLVQHYMTLRTPSDGKLWQISEEIQLFIERNRL